MASHAASAPSLSSRNGTLVVYLRAETSGGGFSKEAVSWFDGMKDVYSLEGCIAVVTGAAH